MPLSSTHTPTEPSALLDLIRIDALQKAALEAALQPRGFRIRSFEGTEAWIAALHDEAPRVLVVPAVDTAELAALLEKLTEGDARLGAVLLLAGGSASQRLDALLEGADAFVAAADPAHFAAEVAGWVLQQDASAFRVLLIEREGESRTGNVDVLHQVGMQVEACADPSEAQTRVETLRPDLILVELELPGSDGLALIAQLRAGGAAAQVPIVMLAPAHRVRHAALRHGVDELLVTPVAPRDLVAEVRSRVKRGRTQRSGSAVIQSRGPRLSRGEFFAELARQVEAPGGAWGVLVALRIDQPDLRKQIGLSAAYALERELDGRLRPLLAEPDRYSLWEEFGFGLLLERDEPARIEAAFSKMLAAVAERPFVVDGQSLSLSLSIGFALPPRERRDAAVDRWIASTFAALAMASRLGGNRAEGLLSRDPNALPPERVMVITQALKDLDRGANLRFEFQALLSLGEARRQFALSARLRDLRSPLQGYPRHEYLALARQHGKLATIERMVLFHAFETVAELQQRGCDSRILVALDLVATDDRQMLWLAAELRRRSGLAAALLLEIDADALQQPEHADLIARLQAAGVRLAAASEAPDLRLFDQLEAYPIELLRLPHALIAAAAANAVRECIRRWHAAGRQLLVDRVDSLQAVSGLWSLGIDFLQGDALASASPRPDIDAGEPH